MLAGLHYEDIKASIRKKYKTLRAFERSHGLPKNSIHNHFRGFTSKRVRVAVERHLAAIVAPTALYDEAQSSTPSSRTHRLNRRAA